MASSTAERATYTLKVHIEDHKLREVLRNGGYRLCVGDARHHGEQSGYKEIKYRQHPERYVIHPKKQPFGKFVAFRAMTVGTKALTDQRSGHGIFVEGNFRSRACACTGVLDGIHYSRW